MLNTKFPIYSFLIIIAIISGLISIFKYSKLISLKKEENFALLIYILIGTIIGGKYFTFLLNFEKYNKILDFSKVGLTSYASVIGILIMIFIFAKQYKKNFRDILFIIMPSVPLMYGIGKIGCFIVGCCHGFIYHGPLNIVYNYSYNAPKNIELFPVQLLESIIFILIYIFISIKIKRVKNKNQIIGYTFLLCGFSKFILDYLRYREVQQIISINQLISIIFIIIGLFIYYKK